MDTPIKEGIRIDAKMVWGFAAFLGSILVTLFGFWLTDVYASVREISNTQDTELNRIVILETSFSNTDKKLESIERKLDKILEKGI